MLGLEEDICFDVSGLVDKAERLIGDKVLLLARRALDEGRTNDEFLHLLELSEMAGEEIGEHKYRMQMLFSYYCFALLEEKYERAGIAQSVYEKTVLDFKFRIYECREVYGFNGIFVAWWYLIFCNLRLQGIGGLEFERTVADFDYNSKGVSVKCGDPIIAVHIPPKFKMNRETVTRALKASYEYYGFEGRVAYQCDSWLLYPDFERVFVEGGNVAEFRSFFDVFRTTDHTTFEDCWRVFKVGEITDLDTLPTDTRLQRNMLEYLKGGGVTGDGFGILVFDGENIL